MQSITIMMDTYERVPNIPEVKFVTLRAEPDTDDARAVAAWDGHETAEFAGVGVHAAPKLLPPAPDSVLAELEVSCPS